TTVPDYTLMPAGTTMVSLAQNVHKPTRTSCLRCHAKAGGGDWTKRGDMGLSTKNPTVAEDVHMSPAVGGKNMTCTSCHVTTKHKIGGRGIDLRQTEAADPKCTNCHTAAPHSNAVLNRHAQGQVGCQTCHIRTFGKGGATEMSRDWLKPVWDPAFCAGQGGYVGTEVKVANVKPEYRWFDGTSYVYNVGEIITKNADGTYTMARANGKAFNGKSQIVPIKNHWSVMPLHPSGKIIPPVIMDMFMTGDFKKAVLAGIKQQGLTGTTYTMVRTNAEMLISHGVDPKSKAPLCTECHATTGKTVDGTKMLPLGKLGYHTWPAKVANCTLCHSAKTSTWEAMHNKHAASNGGSVKLACVSCHTPEPTGLVSAKSILCKTCHSLESWSNSQELHKEHISKGYQCSKCHTGVTIAVAQTTTPQPVTTNALIKPTSDLCNDCHSLKSWSNSTALHTFHAGKGYTCTKCHTGTTTTPPPTPPPTTTGNPLVKPTSDLCNDCHSLKSWSNSATLHTFHAGKGYTCTKCHQA
ncbi:MAG: multiheme c-type cytochrome, partial [Desulfocapsaceae bacterium]|nr:multiheme c-type cytochrome [Desulfocapsaceae bacterium]